MNKWDVVYSAEARTDLKNIYEYIAFQLTEKQTAKNQTNRIMDAIESLNEMPMRFALYDAEPWNRLGLRKLPVDNFIVFYLPDENTRTVNVVRIMYGGRDINKQLNNLQ